MINFTAVTNVLGLLLMMVGALMFTALPFSWYYHSNDVMPIVWSALITISCGLGFRYFRFGSANKTIRKREGYLIVTLGWLSMATFGMLPFLISGEIPEINNAFFETMSGLTTTGASVLNDIEAVSPGILFWRSMTQWIGGMGIIVLTVALLPILGIGGVELFGAEAPGPTSDKLHPRIQGTAARLWALYVGLTLILTMLLWIEGMTFYDAINHALTTMATGGFSTKNASMAAFPPIMQYTVALFMFIAGINYTVIYFGSKLNWRKVWGNEEFKAYFFVTIIITLIVTISVFSVTSESGEKAFRDSLFQVISLMTTTGFVTADYTSWTPFVTMLCFVLLFVGASAGSTAGGIKFIRHLVFFKNSLLEFKRVLHPRAIIPLKINGQQVTPKILTHIHIFLLLFLIVFLLGSFSLSAVGLDFETAIGAAATCLGNVGPGIGAVGPVDNFSKLPASAHWILSFLMLLGRLELYTVLVILTPYFWKSN